MIYDKGKNARITNKKKKEVKMLLNITYFAIISFILKFQRKINTPSIRFKWQV